MRSIPTTGGTAMKADLPGADASEPPSIAVAAEDLDKLARWVPKKEMALLAEICGRAEADRELARPALLLCLAYAERVARMLDQDPFPTVTEKIRSRLQALREQSGL